MSDGAGGIWSALGESLGGHGWRWRALPVEHLADASARVRAALAEIGLTPASADSDGELAEVVGAALPPEVAAPRTLVVGALARPVTQATLVVDGTEHTVVIPPHYAGYYETPRRFAALVAATLAASGHAAAAVNVPFKTLAVGCGLASYGRNNIAYVDGLGSYLQFAACVTDLPCAADGAVGGAAPWGEPQRLAECTTCTACARACPTGAIGGDGFVIRSDRCLTMLNERDAPFPDWVDPAWHTCAVGCLRCQQVCPANAPIELRVSAPVRFDAAESAAILAGGTAGGGGEEDGASGGSAPDSGSAPHSGGRLGADTAAKLAACGLEYEPGPIARNLCALLGAEEAGVTLLLIRHGQTDWNREPARCMGWAEVGLNEAGRAQARERGRALADQDIELIVSSHLLRAVETAELMRAELAGSAPGGELPMVVDPRLAETHRGEWEAQLFREIMAEEPETWRHYREHPESFRFPDGESIGDQQRRVLAALRDVARDGRTALLVTHGGSIRVARCFLEGRGLAAFHDMKTSNAGVDEIPGAGLADRITAFLSGEPDR